MFKHFVSASNGRLFKSMEITRTEFLFLFFGNVIQSTFVNEPKIVVEGYVIISFIHQLITF